MPAFHRNALVAALLASAASVEGFAPVGSTTPRTAANDGSSSTTALSAIDPSAIFPAALFGGAVFATVQFSDKETSVADVVAKKEDTSSPSTTTSTATIEKEPEVAEKEVVEEAKEAEPAPAPAPAKDERKYEFTTPAAKRKKEAKVEAPVPVPAPAPAPTPAAPKAAAAPANKDISEIRNEVASTLDSRKEMQKRLDDAKASRDAAKSKEEPAAVDVTEEDVADEETAAAVDEADDDAREEKVTGRKRRFVGKVVKKVVMPWKKWNSL